MKARVFYLVPGNEKNHFLGSREVAHSLAEDYKKEIFYRVKNSKPKKGELSLEKGLETLGEDWIGPVLDSLSRNIKVIDVEEHIGYISRQ